MEFINEMPAGLQFADLKKTFTDEARERLVASKQGYEQPMEMFLSKGI